MLSGVSVYWPIWNQHGAGRLQTVYFCLQHTMTPLYTVHCTPFAGNNVLEFTLNCTTNHVHQLGGARLL